MFLFFSHIAPSKTQCESKARLPGCFTNCLIYIILCISPEDPTSMCDITSISLRNCFWTFCLILCIFWLQLHRLDDPVSQYKMDNTTVNKTFSCLRRCNEKLIRYTHHLENYTTYRTERMIPNGLTLDINPGIQLHSKSAIDRWNGTLHNASMELLNVLIGSCRKQINSFESTVQQTQLQLKRHTDEKNIQ